VEWSDILRKIGIEKTPDELIHSIVDKEELYGLKTHEFKSVLRLHVVLRGHSQFFEALVDWLERGHRLVIVKGNHDLEWFWPAVRNYLRLDLAERLARRGYGAVEDVLKNTVLPHVTFIDHAMVIDKELYIEHGHPYDPVTRVLGKNTINEGQELNIPFGSFFNRYFLNFVELDYPYIDNIRPTPNILPVMLQKNPLTGLRVLFNNLIVTLRSMRRGYIRYIFGRDVFWRLLILVCVILGFPIALITYQITQEPPAPLPIAVFQWIAVLVILHISIQLLARAQLTEPDSLGGFASHRFDDNPNYRLMTFGHTHNVDQFEDRGRWFFNTGTWIPIVQTSTAEIRVDRTFMFLRIDSENGVVGQGTLQQWCDPAERAERLVLIRRKPIVRPRER